MSDLQDFFKLIAEAKKAKPEKKEEKIIIKPTDLKDFFHALEDAKKESQETLEDEKDKLVELENLLSAASDKKSKRKKVIITKVKTKSKPKPELLQEPEPIKEEVVSEIVIPESQQEIDEQVKQVAKELSKEKMDSSVGGVSGGKDIHEKDIKSFKDLLKEFLRFKKLTIRQLSSLGGGDGGGGSVDFSAVDEDILPDANDTRSLGSTSRRWKKIWLAATTVDLGGATISSDGTGSITIAATGATLPENSKDAGGNPIAVTGTGTRTGGVTITKVPFFTRSGGLSTKNTDFEFNATVDNNKPFLDQSTFVLSNGSGLTSTDTITIFQL